MPVLGLLPTSIYPGEALRRMSCRVKDLLLTTCHSSDTPPSAVGARNRLSPSARERARDNEKRRGQPLCPNRFPAESGGMV